MSKMLCEKLTIYNMRKVEIMANVNRENVLRVLGMHKDELTRDYGLLKLGVLGSVARNEAREDSDIKIGCQTIYKDTPSG